MTFRELFTEIIKEVFSDDPQKIAEALAGADEDFPIEAVTTRAELSDEEEEVFRRGITGLLRTQRVTPEFLAACNKFDARQRARN